MRCTKVVCTFHTSSASSGAGPGIDHNVSHVARSTASGHRVVTVRHGHLAVRSDVIGHRGFRLRRSFPLPPVLRSNCCQTRWSASVASRTAIRSTGRPRLASTAVAREAACRPGLNTVRLDFAVDHRQVEGTVLELALQCRITELLACFIEERHSFCKVARLRASTRTRSPRDRQPLAPTERPVALPVSRFCRRRQRTPRRLSGHYLALRTSIQECRGPES